MASCYDIANYFLNIGSADEGELISNLKLQKLAYYAQGFSLALLGRPLYPEAIEAWDHGPVVPALYHAYKTHGASAIPANADFDPEQSLTPDERELLGDVYLAYGQYTAWKLRNLTHEEAPWKDAYARGSGTVIPLEAIKTYFRENLIEQDQAAVN